jgi:menaquinone-dependent protoporphyrinogen IX oxidase
VLIGTDGSAFKDAVVDQLREGLAASGARVRVADLVLLDSIDPQEYKAVVLIGVCRQWMVDQRISAFLGKARDKNRVFVITTASDTEYKMDMEGVDAVTAASEPGREGEVAGEVLKKVRLAISGD